VPQHFRPGDIVLVLFHTRDQYQVGGEDIEIPEGTQLIGSWDDEQPADGQAYAITIQNIAWEFAKEHVTLRLLEGQVVPWREQERLAQASGAQAHACERRGDLDAALKLYTRALVELTAAGKTEAELTQERLSRAFLLEKAGRRDEAVAEMDRIARTHEAFVSASIYGKSLDDAEIAAQALIAAVTFLIQDMDHPKSQERQKLSNLFDRLLTMNKLIKKRYETKVYLLYTAAEALLLLGKRGDALALFDQAEKFYQQQLAPMEDLSSMRAIITRRERMRGLFGTILRERTARCQITAETADQLQAILDTLKLYVPGLRITKGVTAICPDHDTRKGLRYSAHVSCILPSQEK
jgi:tetratricopeptide (TPR) repeat protein